ncbi:MAG: hypothetical protein JNK14_17790 [Chitinophagaceae bacterium]|nr:hypothetical protein [Chitinophagaceae bacterium]
MIPYALLLTSCTFSRLAISYTALTIPLYKLDKAPQKFLLLSTYNITAQEYRNNKEELFISLTDELMDQLSKKIHEKAGIPAQVVHGYTRSAGNTDSTMHALMVQNQASHAIMIDSFSVYFDQTNVEVTKNYDGSKRRVAYYDIVSDIGYRLYSTDSLVRKMHIRRKRFHSTREVSSVLFNIGPNVVVQDDYAKDITMENGQHYFNCYFPGEAVRNRTLFAGKELGNVNQAVTRGDYETALSESLRFVNDSNKEKAAQACYNCAVFFERKHQTAGALLYLRQSLSLFNLPEAKKMLADFGE